MEIFEHLMKFNTVSIYWHNLKFSIIINFFFKALKLQSVRYTYITYNFQANNNSINTLHLHNL